jgi:DNA-binding cell septation regulator SpoVG
VNQKTPHRPEPMRGKSSEHGQALRKRSMVTVSNATEDRNHAVPLAKIRVLSIRDINKGAVRAVADIGLGPLLIIKEFNIIQQPGQRVWVSLPSREWQGDDGKRRFAPLVELTGSLTQRIEQAILQAWEREGGLVDDR